MGKYLDFYKKCMAKRKMPAGGLCPSFDFEGLNLKRLRLFEPTDSDRREYSVHLNWTMFGPVSFWASGDSRDHFQRFTKMRQNIVLFLAAMSGEDFNELKK